MRKGCFISFIVIVLIAGIIDGIQTCVRNDEYKDVEKKVAEYVEINDFTTANKIMMDEGVNLKSVNIAEVEYLVRQTDFVLARNVASDKLDNEGYYVNAIIENLMEIYKKGGENAVISGLSMVKYPAYGSENPKWWGNVCREYYSWGYPDMNKLYAKHNDAIDKFLIQLKYNEEKVSSKFISTILEFLLPLYTSEGKRDNTMVETIVKKNKKKQ